MTIRRAAAALLTALALTSCAAPADTGRAAQLVNPRATATTPAPAPTPPPPAPAPGVYPVDRVVDGDTVRITRGGKSVTLRLIGGDTPETVHPSKPVQCFGPEASAEAKRLLTGKKVKVVYDPTQGTATADGRRVDYYGRDLVYLQLPDGRDFMEHMIEGGYAREYTYRGEPYQRHAAYNAAETQAMLDGAGLWTAC